MFNFIHFELISVFIQNSERIFSDSYFWIQRSISWGGALLSVKIGTALKKNQHRCSIRFEDKILSLILMILLLMPLIFYSTWYEWKWILPLFGTFRPYFCFCETCWKRHKSFRFFFPWEWSQDTRQTVSHDDKAGIGWGWVSSWFSQHKQQSKLVYFPNDMWKFWGENIITKFRFMLESEMSFQLWMFSREVIVSCN